jgi:hypothetical protein
MTSFFLIETWSPDYRENGFLTWELIQACGSCRGDKIFFRTILYYAKRGGYKSQVENIDSTDS